MIRKFPYIVLSLLLCAASTARAQTLDEARQAQQEAVDDYFDTVLGECFMHVFPPVANPDEVDESQYEWSDEVDEYITKCMKKNGFPVEFDEQLGLIDESVVKAKATFLKNLGKNDPQKAGQFYQSKPDRNTQPLWLE